MPNITAEQLQQIVNRNCSVPVDWVRLRSPNPYTGKDVWDISLADAHLTYSSDRLWTKIHAEFDAVDKIDPLIESIKAIAAAVDEFYKES